MSDEIKNTDNEEPKAEPASELPEAELDQVAGGKPAFNPFSITRKIDKSSPVFF